MKVLIVDDDRDALEGLVTVLKEEGISVSSAMDSEEALGKISDVDLVVTDLKMPGEDGIYLLTKIKDLNPRIVVIIMSGHATVPSAVEAMRRGARGYLLKPFDPEELLLHIREVEELLELRQSVNQYGRGELVGTSSRMKKVYEDIDLAGISNASVLITGETGTGKELAAQAVHNLSRGSDKPFIAVNLGALPRELIESELFGHAKGAFTGAINQMKGRFVLANEGSIFLDEIDSLPIDLQSKLLRVIETGAVWPLGQESEVKVNARVIAATNSDIEELVQKGDFREDLFFRLNVIHIRMPPLRERPEDIPLLVSRLLDRLGETGEEILITPDAIAALLMKMWPGNVRELVNVLELARTKCLLAGLTPLKIEANMFDGDVQKGLSLPFKEAKANVIDEWSRNTVSTALVQAKGNVARAAKILKMNHTALYKLIKKFGFTPDRKKQ